MDRFSLSSIGKGGLGLRKSLAASAELSKAAVAALGCIPSKPAALGFCWSRSLSVLSRRPTKSAFAAGFSIEMANGDEKLTRFFENPNRRALAEEKPGKFSHAVIDEEQIPIRMGGY